MSPVGAARVSRNSQLGGVIPDSLVSRPPDNGVNNGTSDIGLKFSTSQEWPSFQARLSGQTSPISGSLLVIGDTNGTDLDSIDISNNTANDVITFNDISLSANDSYSIYVRKSNKENVGYYDSPSFPYVSSDGNLSIDAGWVNGIESTNIVWGLSEIGNITGLNK